MSKIRKYEGIFKKGKKDGYGIMLDGSGT